MRGNMQEIDILNGYAGSILTHDNNPSEGLLEQHEEHSCSNTITRSISSVPKERSCRIQQELWVMSLQAKKEFKCAKSTCSRGIVNKYPYACHTSRTVRAATDTRSR